MRSSAPPQSLGPATITVAARGAPWRAWRAWRQSFLLALAFTFPLVLRAQTPYQTPNAPLLGAAWYPEQWPESAWERDLTLMQDAGFNVVRVGEFAWAAMEPAEGRYDLDWLDRAITLAGRHGLKVVIGTPTDAPPAWLTRKYPETLGMNADGHLREHGGRRQFNYANPHYRELCAAVVRQLAQRFGHNPNVMGWQIDNEYTDESFDPATVAQFQSFLHARYGSLANLNARWSTAYWSQTYTAWSQIPMESTGGNPGLLLEHKHFVTATWRSYQQNQIDVLRPLIDPHQFITTNIGGLAWSDNWDHYSISAPLDIASWDDYVGEGHLDAARNAMLNDFVRGWRRQNFWVMETQPGSVNWAPVSNALAPGETRALAWQAIGHGADAILYWQWRPALNGQEQYHGSLVGPGGDPLPLYKEVQQLGRDLAAARAALAGTQPHARIALLHTYDSRWALDFQLHTRLYDQQQVMLRFYAPLQQMAQSMGESVDIIDPTQSASLDGYKLLVAPSLNVIDEALAAKLLAWVKNGGTLLLGPRSGMKDGYDALNPQRQPGPLAAALGATVEQYYALDHPVHLRDGADDQGSVDVWAEALTPGSPDAHAYGQYVDRGGWLDGKAAVIGRKLGKGYITYLGTLPDKEYLHVFLSSLLPLKAETPWYGVRRGGLPSNPELCVREAGGRRVLILINHSETSTRTLLPGTLRNLLNDPAVPVTVEAATTRGGRADTAIELPPQGVAVLLSTSEARR